MSNDQKRTNTPKSSLVIRIVVGMYLIYLAYQLFMGLNSAGGAPVAVAVGAGLLFAVCGVVLVFVSGRAFLKGDYQRGIIDEPKESDVSESE